MLLDACTTTFLVHGILEAAGTDLVACLEDHRDPYRCDLPAVRWMYCPHHDLSPPDGDAPLYHSPAAQMVLVTEMLAFVFTWCSWVRWHQSRSRCSHQYGRRQNVINAWQTRRNLQLPCAKAVSTELEWIRTNPKAKGNKTKARLSRYDELLEATAPKELPNAGQIYIPPGPRLGHVVIDVSNVRKSFGERLLFKDLTFSLPPAGNVGVIGPNGA